MSAKDKGTGKEQNTNSSIWWFVREINKMVKDAEANKEADKKKRDGVDANQADSIVFYGKKFKRAWR